MEQRTKSILTYICIVIIIIIIIRFIYLTQNIEESFTDAVDLLSKYKSIGSSTSVLGFSDNIDLVSGNLEQLIYPWSNKIYNMQSTTLTQTKAITLYKPNLTISNNADTSHNGSYYKLGDMVSQDSSYIKPSATEFTLLINKQNSDTKPPQRFDLVVDIGDPNVNRKYHKFLNFFTDITSLKNITSSLYNCSVTLQTLNWLIATNINSLESPLENIITATYLNMSGPDRVSMKFISNPNSTNFPPVKIWDDWHIVYPSNLKIYLAGNDDGATYDISIPNYLANTLENISINADAIDKTKLSATLPFPFNNYKTSITPDRIKDIQSYILPIFPNLPVQIIFNYIKNLCLDIKNIYDIHTVENYNTTFFNYLNLVSKKEVILAMLIYMDNNPNMNSNEFIAFLGKYVNDKIDGAPTLLGIAIYTILNAQLKVNIIHILFDSRQLYIWDPQMLTVSGFQNIISQIPASNYDIFNFNRISGITPIDFTDFNNRILTPINEFLNFAIQLQNGNINAFPLKTYNPVAPDGYVSLGHVFGSTPTDIDNIKASNSVVCVPSHCVKEIRNWNTSDKIYEYNKKNVYWAIYLNPYTGTFISTNTNQLPVGKVSKVVACVNKCTAVDDLKNADDCARKYYNKNKQGVSSTPIIQNLVGDQEEQFYLSKIKAQSDSIAMLGQRAQNMQSTMDKSNIVNRAMNKNTLQNYVDTQKRNIGIVANSLIDDKNKIQTNVEINPDTIFKIIKNIQNSTLPEEQKKLLISQITNTKNADGTVSYQACPAYDLTGLVKKTDVGDLCYGCGTPE